MSVFNGCAGLVEAIPDSDFGLAGLGGEQAILGAASVALPPLHPPAACRPLHRLGEVRRAEGLTCSQVAQRLGMSISDTREQEQAASDISLSDLYRWQKALGVPVAELLQEPEGDLSSPVRLRAKLVRVMKTVRSIQERTDKASLKRLAQSLADQLVKIMPELEHTVAWPAIGPQRRGNEVGETFFRRLPAGPWDEFDRPAE